MAGVLNRDFVLICCFIIIIIITIIIIIIIIIIIHNKCKLLSALSQLFIISL